MIPNYSPIAYSRNMGCFVGLHKYDDGEIWLVRKHHDHFCTVRKATDADKEAFQNLNSDYSDASEQKRAEEKALKKADAMNAKKATPC